MKTTIFFAIIIIGILYLPLSSAFGQEVSGLNHPGIKWNWKIKAENYTFNVITVSNYDMKNVTFNKIDKELIFTGNSTHGENIAEIEIPHNLIGGNLTTTINGQPISPIVVNGTDSSTMMLKFNQTGTNTVSVMGTTYLPEFSSTISFVLVLSIVMLILFTVKFQKIQNPLL